MLPSETNDFNAMINALSFRGYNSSSRKYLIFMDSSNADYCGLGDLQPDDQPGLANANNMGPSYAVLWCWDGATAAHELMHTLGAVQDSAPHSTSRQGGGGHCTDDFDVMCYKDADSVTMTYACPSVFDDNFLDCRNDDYFHTSPTASNYLSNHWNTANSSWLFQHPCPPDQTTVLACHNAYGNFAGGGRVATGDIDGDLIDEIVTGAGVGGGPHVRVFKVAAQSAITTFTLVEDIWPFPGGFTGGVNVAMGDVDGDLRDEIIVGAGGQANSTAHVKVYKYNPLATTKFSELFNFYAYNLNFHGGVFVAAGNVDSAPGDEIITGAGPGGGAHVRVWKRVGTQTIESFGFYPWSFSGGVRVAAGNVDQDPADEIITAQGSGGTAQVRVYNQNAPPSAGLAFEFTAYSGFVDGVYVAAGNVDGNLRDEIITGAGSPGGPDVRVWRTVLGTTTPLAPVTVVQSSGGHVYDPNFLGGMRVAAGDFNKDFRDDLIHMPDSLNTAIFVIRPARVGAYI
ncbi:MAG: hypothetical protein ABIS18_07400 [Actinomycetota bacterium]